MPEYVIAQASAHFVGNELRLSVHSSDRLENDGVVEYSMLTNFYKVIKPPIDAAAYDCETCRNFDFLRAALFNYLSDMSCAHKRKQWELFRDYVFSHYDCALNHI